MNKIVLIIPYFGKLPNYFDLFLNSCSKNETIDFLIFSDNNIKNERRNIKTHNISFDKFNEIVKEKTGYKVSSPYKLCDFKPLYGKIFEDYIKKYTHWGYCDCDLIFGDLSILFTKEILDKYEKILSDGHLTIFKNISKINSIYKEEFSNIIPFRKVAIIKEPCFFDEVFMPEICKKKKINTYINKSIYADILPNKFSFKMPQENLKSQIFKYENGKLFRVNDKKEYIYIHLQKRSMIKKLSNNKNYYIIPNAFTNNSNNKHNYRSVIKFYYKYFVWYIKRMNLNKILIKIKVTKIKRRFKK